MSRSYCWEYVQTWDSGAERVVATAIWERFFYDCPLPVKYVPAGACHPEQAAIFLYATAAKARRLTGYLDEYFGRPGELTRTIP